MKNHILILFASLFPYLGLAQTQTIRGRVINKDTQQPIAGATLVVQDLSPMKGAVSDETGSFKIVGVPVGRQIVKCTFIGFEDYVTDNLILNSVKEMVLDIQLVEVGIQMEGVDITVGGDDNPHEAINSFNPVSMRSFSVEETQRYAGSFNDPSRMAMGFAGVQASQDNNSDIIIRGNSPAGLLWRLEGIDIPNPNHFARKGSSGGGITVFSAQLLAKSDFSTGAFSAEYGNATSGVFDMRFRRGNTDKSERRFKFGLLGTDLALEGPIKKGQSSYLVNYRYSTLGILNDIGFRLVGERIDNNFQDLSFNIYLPSKDLKNTWTIFGMGGLSEELWDPVEDSLSWSRPYRTTRDYLTRVGAAGITYTRLIDNKSFLKAVVAVSGNQVIDNDDTLDIRTVVPSPNPDMLEEEIDWTSLDETPFEKEDYRNTRISSHIFYSRQFSPSLTMKNGIIASHINYGFNHEERNAETNAFGTLVEGEGSSQLLQAYSQFKIHASDRLTLNAGVHASMLSLNNSGAIDPRLSLKYQMPDRQSISLAYGLHSQILPLGSYFTEVERNGETTQPNLDLDMIRAHHAVLAYEKIFENRTRLLLETYYQRLFNLPISPDSEPSDFMLLNLRDGYGDRALVSNGTGTNLGLDLTFEKYFSQGFFFLFTGSVYESNYVASDGETYNTRYNSRYNQSLMGGTEIPLKKGGSLQLGARSVLNGGLRFTPGDEAASKLQGEFVEQPGQAFALGVGTYYRIDFRIAYRKNLKKTAYILSLDVQNVTNRRNVRDQIYDPGFNRLQNRFQSGLVPVFSFQIDF